MKSLETRSKVIDAEILKKMDERIKRTRSNDIRQVLADTREVTELIFSNIKK